MSNRITYGLDRLIYEFENPSEEFSLIPFWFWNDTLTEEEISRQIHAFKEKGVDGFVIHARIGLDPDIAYMGDRWLHFVRYAVNLAASLNMKVILYDDAMYPSGSCSGQVVLENPDFCSKGLRMSDSSELAEGESLIATVAWKGAPRYFILTATRGVMRGTYYGQDDTDPNAPPTADLLNPDSVACFIRLTHEKYFAALSEHFGKTVIAIFTDEPDLQGRLGIDGLLSWTGDFLADFLATGYTEADLPLLFDHEDEKAAEVQAAYDRVLFARMNRSYYGQLATWCKAHKIELTGHPARSDDIYLLSHFGIPCQDVVWRDIYPGEPTNINGPHSTMGKCASDSARHRNKRRNGNECFGVCGHRDDPYAFDRLDMKWYIDWLFVRGCNLIIPHAFYYSVRGPRRSERPPQVGMNGSFWHEYNEISDYIKRCSAINTDSVNVTDIAILCTERHLPDLPARPLYENQIEFNYLERTLLDEVVLENGTARIAKQCYRIVITDGELDKKTSDFLTTFQSVGGTVLHYSDYAENNDAYLAALCRTSRTITKIEHHKDLRLTRVCKHGVDILFLSNEGEGTITTTVHEPIAQIWDSELGTRTLHDGKTLNLTLAPRKSIHLILK